jgi:hypothetical protein
MLTRESRYRLTGSHRLVCVILLLAHFALSAQFAFILPVHESYDEPAHYAYVRYIAVNHKLPPSQTFSVDETEMHQPPLYYALAALGISWIDVSDDRKSQFLWGAATAVKPDPVLNDPAQSGTALANRVARLVSALLSTIAVWCTYLTVLRIAPARHGMALLAAAIHGLWPMFVFMGGVISNDIGVGMAGSLVFLFATRLFFRTQAPSRKLVRWMDYLGFALSMTAAVLMKDTGVALVVFGGAMALLLLVRALFTRQYTDAIRVVLCAVCTIVLLAAAYVVSDGRTARQLGGVAGVAGGLAERIVGFPGGLSSATGATSSQSELVIVSSALLWFAHTLLGVFGRGSNSLPDSWYAVATLILMVGLIGFFVALARRRYRLATLYTLFFISCVMAAPLARAVTSGDAGLMHGRFALAAFGAASIFLALGLCSLPRLARQGLSALVVGGFAFVSVAAPIVIVRPMYEHAPLYVGPVQGFVAPNPTSVTFGDAIQLIGYEIPKQRAIRTGTMNILLYWHAIHPLDHRYVLRLEAFSTTGISFGSQVESQPALGSFPTTKWNTTDVYREGYYLQVWDHVDAPTIGAFRATWVDSDTGKPLAITCADLKPCNPLLGAVPISLPRADIEPWLNRATEYKLGNLIDMVDASVQASVTAGDAMTVSVVWRSRTASLPPLTTFVHLVDQNDKIVAQTDSPARSGQYPTEVWAAGDVVPDSYNLMINKDMAPGTYTVKMGLYNPKTVVRMPVVDQSGQSVKDDAISLGDVIITQATR